MIHTLREVLNIAKTMSMHFNPDKCIFKQKKKPFFGMLDGENGIEPDPQKIDDLKVFTGTNNLLIPPYSHFRPIDTGYMSEGSQEEVYASAIYRPLRTCY